MLGIPLALAFAAMAARFPDAGGVSTYTTRAFGPAAGAVVGWFYFFAAATGQVIVSLTGAHYAAPYLGLDRIGTFLLAGGIIMLAVAANLRGLKVSGPIAFLVSAAVVLLLAAAALSALPRIVSHWTPFVPKGWNAVGEAGVFLFFAFFGWEAIAHLSEEFIDPKRDVPRATIWSVLVITILYVGVAAAVVGTGTYGEPSLDRTAVARLLADGLGVGSGQVAAGMALTISLGTANAFVASTSRLGYALARDRAFPPVLSRVDKSGVPMVAVAGIGVYAMLGLLVSAVARCNVETLLIVPNTLGVATYVIGTAAGVRLLSGLDRLYAAIGCVLCFAILPFAGASLLIPSSSRFALWRRGSCFRWGGVARRIRGATKSGWFKHAFCRGKEHCAAYFTGDHAARWALIAASVGFFMVVLDTTIVNVALPAIRDTLGGGITAQQWLVDGYAVVFASLLLTAGLLSDRFGARRLFVVGLLFFSVSSLAAASHLR